jgi:hypothetical protein
MNSDSDSNLDTDFNNASNKDLDNNYPLADVEILVCWKPHDNFPHIDNEGMGY